MRNRIPTDCAWDVPLFIHSAYHFTVPWVSCTAEPPESFLVAYDFLFRVFFPVYFLWRPFAIWVQLLVHCIFYNRMILHVCLLYPEIICHHFMVPWNFETMLPSIIIRAMFLWAGISNKLAVMQNEGILSPATSKAVDSYSAGFFPPLQINSLNNKENCSHFSTVIFSQENGVHFGKRSFLFRDFILIEQPDGESRIWKRLAEQFSILDWVPQQDAK